MNPWKIATIGIGAVVATGLTSGLTTAYFARSAPETQANMVSPLTAAPSASGAPAAVATGRPASLARATSRPAAPAPIAPIPTRTVSAPVSVGVPADCTTGGDRAWRIAKPGAIGGLVGAGLGAAGGAIADGGSGAGKGALIGGIAGAALGTGYGAYKTKNECGTILGSNVAPSGAPAGVELPSQITRPIGATVRRTPEPRSAKTPQAALQATARDLQIYSVR